MLSRSLRVLTALAVAAGATASGSCGDGAPLEVQPSSTAASMLVVSGSDQHGAPGEMLPEPLVVQVLDENGSAIEGQIVNFHVVAGGGSPFGGTAVTNADGIAQERWILGSDTINEQRIEARAVHTTSGEPLVFSVFKATAGAKPPSNDDPVTVTNLAVVTGAHYKVVETFLEGMTTYIDRSFTFVGPIPPELDGRVFIRTANNDKTAHPGMDTFLSFDVNRDAMVYVAHDDRLERPEWLGSFTNTGLRIHNTDVDSEFSLFRKTVPAGTVTLGSNTATAASTSSSMYTVIIVPNDAPPDTASPPEEDTEAPTVPQNLLATPVSASQINLEWNPSSDDVGVAGYRISRGGAQVATTAATSYSDTGLSANTTYSYTVAAFDAAGNVSSDAGPVTASTHADAECTAPPGAPYDCSAVVGQVSIDWNTLRTEAHGSDNWPVTWSADGHQYTSWGDGGGFGGTNWDGRVSLGFGRVSGEADSYTGINLWGGKNPQQPATFDGKTYGMIALGTTLYAWVSPGSDQTNYTETRLAKSTDNGLTWSKLSWSFTSGDGIILPTILQFGAGYAGARDGYVYSYFTNLKDGSGLKVQKPGEIVLARVPVGSIENKAAYEWFTGLDGSGNATWTPSVSQRKPVFADPNGVGWNVAVTFNAGLERYLLTTEHTTTGQSNLGIFDAPEPWGPWSTVLYEDSWGSGHVETRAFYWNFSNKWLSSDGLDFVLMFSGFGETDSWNTVQGSFTLR